MKMEMRAVNPSSLQFGVGFDKEGRNELRGYYESREKFELQIFEMILLCTRTGKNAPGERGTSAFH